jgi:hypothetical protein
VKDRGMCVERNECRRGEKARARLWHMEEDGIFLICESLFECGVSGADMEPLTVITQNSRLGRMFSDRCLAYPDTSSRNGRVLKKVLLNRALRGRVY